MWTCLYPLVFSLCMIVPHFAQVSFFECIGFLSSRSRKALFQVEALPSGLGGDLVIIPVLGKRTLKPQMLIIINTKPSQVAVPVFYSYVDCGSTKLQPMLSEVELADLGNEWWLEHCRTQRRVSGLDDHSFARALGRL